MIARLKARVLELYQSRNALLSRATMLEAENAALRAKAAEFDRLVDQLETKLQCAQDEAQEARWEAMGEDL